MGIGFQRLHPQVERPIGCDVVIAKLVQALGKQLAVGSVGGGVHRLVHAGGDDALEEHRRADVAQRTAGAGNGEHYALRFLHLVGNQHVADAVARKRKRLRPGVAHQGVVVDGRHPRNLGTVDKLAVRLVGDKVQRAAQLFALLMQQGGKAFQRFARVHHAHRVVGRVDDDGARALVDGGAQGLEVDLEVVFAGGHFHALAAVGLDPNAVLGEVRRDDDDLVARVQQHGLDAAGKAGSSARGEIEVLCGVVGAEAAVQVLGDGRFGGVEAGCLGVGMQFGRRHLGKLADNLCHLCRSRNAGIADAEIEHLVFTDLGLTLKTVGEQLANSRRGVAQAVHGFVDHE